MAHARMWVIVSDRVGLYAGTYFTRVEAISAHVEALQGIRPSFLIQHGRYRLTKNAKRAWQYHRRKGDRAVRAAIAWD